MNPTEPAPKNHDKLINDLRQVIRNAEDLLKHTEHHTGNIYKAARAKLELTLLAAYDELNRFEDEQLSRIMERTHLASDSYRDQTGEEVILRAFK